MAQLLSRRHFAKNLGAAMVLLPLFNARAQSASPQRRLLIMTSLGTDFALWQPTSRPGAPLQLSTMMAPLQSIADKIVVVDGLSFANPSEGHSTPQTLTGRGFGDVGNAAMTSVDQYIAQKIARNARVPTLLLGSQAKNEGQFWLNGRRLAPIDSPSDAYQLAFGIPQTSTPLPRQSILDIVDAQIKELQGTVGSAAKARLDAHRDSIAQLEKSLGNGVPVANAPPAPVLSGQDPEADKNTSLMGELNLNLICSAFAAGVTQIAGLQWGVSNHQYLSDSAVNTEEHGAVHSGAIGQPSVIAAETYLAKVFVSAIQKLSNLPDPSGQGSLLDHTLVLWTRDIGDGPSHKQFSMPYILAGGSGYLKTTTQGNYVSYGGSNDQSVIGQPHERLLYNLCEFMGVKDWSGLGRLPTGQKIALPEVGTL